MHIIPAISLDGRGAEPASHRLSEQNLLRPLSHLTVPGNTALGIHSAAEEEKIVTEAKLGPRH